MSGLPEAVAQRLGWTLVDAVPRGICAVHRACSRDRRDLHALEHGSSPTAANGNAPLQKSRAIVVRLTTLFALDAFGGGFVIDSLVMLWLFRRFDLSLQVSALSSSGRACLRLCRNCFLLVSRRASGLSRRWLHAHPRKCVSDSCRSDANVIPCR